MTAIGLDSFVQRSASAVFAEVDGETVALDVDRGMCYGLNVVATRIWELIEQPTQVKAICETLLSEFSVDRQTCEDHTISLLEELRAEQLVVEPAMAD